MAKSSLNTIEDAEKAQENGINISRKSRNRKSNQENSKSSSPIFSYSFIALGIVLSLVLFFPEKAEPLVCLIPFCILFTLKDILDIPFNVIAVIIIAGFIFFLFIFFNALVGLGMY